MNRVAQAWVDILLAKKITKKLRCVSMCVIVTIICFALYPWLVLISTLLSYIHVIFTVVTPLNKSGLWLTLFNSSWGIIYLIKMYECMGASSTTSVIVVLQFSFTIFFSTTFSSVVGVLEHSGWVYSFISSAPFVKSLYNL